MAVVDPHHQRSQAASLSAIRPIMMNGPDLGSTTVMERLNCTGRKLLRRLLGYFWPQTSTSGTPSKVAKVNRLRFFGHILRRPADRLVQRVLRSLSGSSWKKPPGRKRKFWTEMMKEDLRTLGVDRIWNSDEWIDSVQALADDREGWAELSSSWHTSAKMRVIASGDDISPLIK
ncbi:hypothetical protein RB195_024925 [Necator americanus]|uniref:Uncharacterized protein n=1 Tax=Necator americanus TaxID=51031 RepID=A0ABR1EQ68_NECAM